MSEETTTDAAQLELKKVAVKVYRHLHKTLTGHEPETPLQNADYRNIEFIGQYLRGAYGNGNQQGRAQGLLEAKTAVLLSAQELCPCGGSESGSGCDVCDMYHDINRQLNRLAQAIQRRAEETGE